MIRLLQGDCLDVLKTLDADSLDACVTDPPYGLSFMGKAWDSDVPPEAIWREVYRVLKPGAHLLAFFGSRTYHRGVTKIEDAGFEIRDQIMWLYGSGFPKSLDVSKAIDKAAGADREAIGQYVAPDGKPRGIDRGIRGGQFAAGNSAYTAEKIMTTSATDLARQWEGWGTALKPAHEPIVVARKPLIGTVVENVLKHGTGALNIDECRIAAPEGSVVKIEHRETGSLRGYDGGIKGGSRVEPQTLGRWPANVVHDGSEEVLAGFPQTGPSSGRPRVHSTSLGSSGSGVFGKAGAFVGTGHADEGGSAARFFKECKWSEEDWHHLSNNGQPANNVESQSGSCETPTVLDPVGTKNSDSRSEESQAIPDSTGNFKGFTQQPSPALDVAAKESTGTTQTTRNRSSSNGFVSPVTGGNINLENEARAEVDNDPVKGTRFRYCPKADKADRGEGNNHPTVKPTDLMRWLVRLVTPPGGTVIDPFMGSGSTGKAAELEGVNFIGIDIDPKWVEVSRARISGDAPLFAKGLHE